MPTGPAHDRGARIHKVLALLDHADGIDLGDHAWDGGRAYRVGAVYVKTRDYNWWDALYAAKLNPTLA